MKNEAPKVEFIDVMNFSDGELIYSVYENQIYTIMGPLADILDNWIDVAHSKRLQIFDKESDNLFYYQI